MRKKDDLAIEKIIGCAKTEFLEKGFEGASMRKVAENAGVYYRHALRQICR